MVLFPHHNWDAPPGHTPLLGNLAAPPGSGPGCLGPSLQATPTSCLLSQHPIRAQGTWGPHSAKKQGPGTPSIRSPTPSRDNPPHPSPEPAPAHTHRHTPIPQHAGEPAGPAHGFRSPLASLHAARSFTLISLCFGLKNVRDRECPDLLFKKGPGPLEAKKLRFNTFSFSLLLGLACTPQAGLVAGMVGM